MSTRRPMQTHRECVYPVQPEHRTANKSGAHQPPGVTRHRAASHHRVSIVGGYLLLRRSLQPLHEIATIAEQITSRNLNERLPGSQTGDEIEQLTKALNRMMSRLEESFHHVHRFSADVSARDSNAIDDPARKKLEDLIRSTDLRSESRDSAASALEEAERLSRVAEQLLEMTRLEAGEMLAASSHVDLSDLTQNAVDQMRLLTEEKQSNYASRAVNRFTSSLIPFACVRLWSISSITRSNTLRGADQFRFQASR